MKRFFSFLLTLVLVLSLVACGKSEPETPTLLGNQKFDTFVAGYGKVDCTPNSPVYLEGYQNNIERLSTGVKDAFYALTTALTDTNGNTLLIIVTDLAFGDIDQTNEVRAAVKEKFGIPAENVLVGGTHNHNGPAYNGEASTRPENRAYLTYWLQCVVKSVEQALNDRKPAQINIGAGDAEGLTFVRRYFRADGCLTGAGLADRYPDCNEPIVAYESEGDNEAQFVKFVREGAEDILIAQWQCHATTYGNTTIASTDWVGPMREKMEEELGCHVMYMQGFAGNMNPNTREPFTKEYPTVNNVDIKGGMIADAFLELVTSDGFFTPINSGDIKVKQQIYSDAGTYRPQYWEVEMTSVAIGELSLIAIPVEMHAESGLEIKEGTPFKMTLMMGYTNGIGGYVATRLSYENGGYGVVDGRANENSADNMVKLWLEQLNELHG